MSGSGAKLKIWVTGDGALRYEFPDRPPVRLDVGKPMELGSQQDVGIKGEKLSRRHVAFLILLVLDREGELRSDSSSGAPRPQRLTIAEYLGLPLPVFQRWAARNLLPQPGSILQWVPETILGPLPSRTGGPWRLAVRSARLHPDMRGAWDFIESVSQRAAIRRTDPLSLLEDAETQAAMDNWKEAETIVESACETFHRRRWRRDDPLWFDILLRRAHIAMQLGASGGTPQHARNILRSLNKQRLDTVDAAIVAAKAHLVAALVWGQRSEMFATGRVLTALQSAEDGLRGIREERAVEQLWRVRGYREVALAKARGEAKPPTQSHVLQAAEALEDFEDEGRLRYGQILLCADQPNRAVEYIRPALESGNLSRPAWIIAERLNAAAEWRMGASADSTLEKLETIRKEARYLGFAHQLRVIQRQKRKVQRQDRSVVTK